jgi:hypothetical protein
MTLSYGRTEAVRTIFRMNPDKWPELLPCSFLDFIDGFSMLLLVNRFSFSESFFEFGRIWVKGVHDAL